MVVPGRGEESHSGQSSDEPGIRGILDLPMEFKVYI